MGIFRPCPKSNFRHLDFPCFRLAPGQDLIWFESTTLGFQIHSKEFPTRFQICRGGPRSDHADHIHEPELHKKVA